MLQPDGLFSLLVQVGVIGGNGRFDLIPDELDYGADRIAAGCWTARGCGHTRHMDKPPSPEDLRREYLVQEQIKDVRRVAKRKRFITRWIWISAIMGLAASLMNYYVIVYACIGHFIFSGFAGWLLLHFKRGHLSGMVLVGLGNMVIAVFGGPFNPFGPLGFALAGAFIGMGQRLEEDMQ